jgi:hypothetical protein
MSGDGWAPVDACTLPTPEQPLREAEFDALFATALRRIERPEPERLRLTFDADAEVEDLVARESSCCSFFDFELATTSDGQVLDVRVPSARVAVLDGLARRAAVLRAECSDLAECSCDPACPIPFAELDHGR